MGDRGIYSVWLRGTCSRGRRALIYRRHRANIRARPLLCGHGRFCAWLPLSAPPVPSAQGGQPSGPRQGGEGGRRLQARPRPPADEPFLVPTRGFIVRGGGAARLPRPKAGESVQSAKAVYGTSTSTVDSSACITSLLTPLSQEMLQGCTDYWIFVVAALCFATTQMRDLSNVTAISFISLGCVIAVIFSGKGYLQRFVASLLVTTLDFRSSHALPNPFPSFTPSLALAQCSPSSPIPPTRTRWMPAGSETLI